MTREEVITYLKTELQFDVKSIGLLDLYVDELLKFNKQYNLISRSTESIVWDRHILDSAQTIKFINPAKNLKICDLGAGAGLPGLIIAIYGYKLGFHVKLYEKSSIKCRFLKNLINKLKIDNVIVENINVYDIKIRSDYVVTRAFKKLSEVLSISREIVSTSHKLILLKGKGAEEEIKKVNFVNNYKFEVKKSITDPESKILIFDVKK